MPRVNVRCYEVRSAPSRLAVGDIIRCPDFCLGLRFTHDPSVVVVAWQDRRYPDYHIRVGNGTAADDGSRGAASFMITGVELTESDGPDDVFPGNHRLSRDVRCVRLTQGLEFSADSERIRFSLDEPMSVAQPSEESIKVLGYAELPVSWDVSGP